MNGINNVDDNRKINKSIESVAWQTVIQVIYGSILSAPFHFIESGTREKGRRNAMH